MRYIIQSNNTKVSKLAMQYPATSLRLHIQTGIRLLVQQEIDAVFERLGQLIIRDICELDVRVLHISRTHDRSDVGPNNVLVRRIVEVIAIVDVIADVFIPTHAI